MEERSSSSSSSTKIIQKSIKLFLKNCHFFTFTSALLIFPYSITYLLSQHQSLFSSSLYSHFKTLFSAANFPGNSIINLKLSQTISSSLISLPFTLTSLLLSKTLLFHFLNPNRTSSTLSNYLPILRTYICSWLVLLSSNATVFFLIFFAFNAFQRIPLSETCITFVTAFGVTVYCVVVANAMVVCGLGFVVSGVEGVGGTDAIIKAWILIRGKASTAVLLAVAFNLGFVAMEGLFRVRVFRSSSSFSLVGVAEGVFIGYVYSVLIVVEAIVTYVFYKKCCCSTAGYYREEEDEEEDSSRYHQLNIYTSDRAKESMLL